MSDAEARFSARVPRYTSYPTAPHFDAGVGGNTYAQWLSTTPEELPLSLYIHIPFCDTLCWFCGCHTAVVNHYRPVAQYLDLLRSEIALVSDALITKRRVTHIHWGGGSPTLLSPRDIQGLNRAIRDRFDIAPNADFAIEIDPRGFRAETAAALAEAGANRASIGVQDCDPQVQRAINRIQSEAETEAAVALLRSQDIRSLNVDLIYGLPYQRRAGLEQTIEFVCSLNPGRLAIFGYAHVPHFKKHQALIDDVALPGIGERLDQAEAATALLVRKGFMPVGLDHFARPDDPLAIAASTGRLARNFQGYTTDDAPLLIGFGASAIGSLPQGYVQNASDVPTYRALIEKGLVPVARGIALTPEDRLRRHIIERLMCDLRIDLAAACGNFGFSLAVLDEAIERLAPLVADRVVTIDRGVVEVSANHRMAVRLVCAAFDAYLGVTPTRHSLAI